MECWRIRIPEPPALAPRSRLEKGNREEKFTIWRERSGWARTGQRKVAGVVSWVYLLGWAGILWATEWQSGWYLDGGGYWAARLQVTVSNLTDRPMEGSPVPVPIGSGPGEANLVGTEARAIRVVRADGQEVLFALVSPQGQEIRTGSIPAGTTLLLPAECPPKEKSTYWIYFDNPLAGQLPDFLPDRLDLVNGDLEEGEGDRPIGWVHDRPDADHQTFWSTENPRSGKRCLKTLVAQGALPSWIATRQTNIAVRPGGRYRFRAWVRAEAVQGYAGWYLHLGNAKKPIISAPMLKAGGGTYDWKQVALEFEVPDQADRLSVGTVLWGTGTAWFDLAELEPLDPSGFRVEAGPVERLRLQELRPPSAWPPAEPSRPPALRRVVIRAENFFAQPVEGLLAGDISALNHRLGGRLDAQRLRWKGPNNTRNPILLGDRILVEASLPGRTVLSGYLYYGPVDRAPAEPFLLKENIPGRPAQAATVPSAPVVKAASTALKEAPAIAQAEYYAQFVQSRWNLLKNGSFEASPPLAPWEATVGPQNQKVEYTLDMPGGPGLGKRCARLHIPRGIPRAWRGWRQSVAVRPKATYLVAAWIRTEQLEGGNAQIHVHIYSSRGELSRQHPIRSTGRALQRSSDWTLVSGLFPMPEDAARLQVHLTTEGFGTVWYDGVVVAEVIPGRIVAWESRPLEPQQVAVWPVNPLVKVFPDEPVPPAWGIGYPASAQPPGSCQYKEKPSGHAVPAQGSKNLQAFPEVELYLAQNEQEALQLAIRTGRSWKKVYVEADSPSNAQGQRLPKPEVAVVGYVPVDYPSNYYISTTPRWHRKVPRSFPGSDGFAGLWPDPLLPKNWFSLSANRTQAVWLTFQTPKDAPAGVYKGRIRLVGEVRLGDVCSEGDSAQSEGTSRRSQRVVLAEVPYQLHVWNFTLPDRPHLKAIYDVRFGHGLPFWGQSEAEAYREVAAFMARRRLQPDGVRPEPIFRYKDRQVEVDFTEFDRAADWYFNRLGLRHSYMPWHFYLFGWGHPPKKIGGQSPYPGQAPYEKADRAVLRPEYKHLYQQTLRLFWNHVKQKGWADRFVLYISDEPFFRKPEILAQMKALCEMIHELDPAIPIYSSTWHHVPDWDDALDVWGIGHYGIVPLEQMQRLVQQGKRVWFTTDGQMCLDTPFCAIERLLPHYCFHYGAEAYEFWGVAWTTYDPYRYGWHAYIHQSDQPGKHYWVRYPNGDGYLIYPGRPIGYDGPVSSIRLEQAREGVEDYEYLHMLRNQCTRLPPGSRAAQQGQKLLQDAASLLRFPNPGGRYSSRILPDPDRLLQLRVQWGQWLQEVSSLAP